MYIIGVILTFILAIVVATIYYLHNHQERSFDLVGFGVVTVIATLIASALSWVSILVIIIAYITAKIHNKKIMEKHNKKN